MPQITFTRYEHLQPHQQRMVKEWQELGERLEKLETFMTSRTFSELSEGEQKLMQRQAEGMRAYYCALEERITLFV